MSSSSASQTLPPATDAASGAAPSSPSLLRGQNTAEAVELVRAQREAKRLAKEQRKRGSGTTARGDACSPGSPAAAAAGAPPLMGTPPESPAAVRADRVPVYVPRAERALATCARDVDFRRVRQELLELRAMIDDAHDLDDRSEGDDPESPTDATRGSDPPPCSTSNPHAPSARLPVWRKVTDAGEFAPNFGCACVMRFFPSQIERFCNSLAATLARFPAIQRSLVLLPPGEYRTTLTPLEFTGKRRGGLLHRDESCDAAARAFTDAQTLLDDAMASLPGLPGSALKFVAVVPHPELLPAHRDFKSAMGIRLEPCAGFEKALRAVGDRIQLLLGRSKAHHRQFAFGVGYFRFNASPSDRLACRIALYEALLRVLSAGFDLDALGGHPRPPFIPPDAPIGYIETLSSCERAKLPPLRFEVALQHPEIIRHNSMAAVTPLFPRRCLQAAGGPSERVGGGEGAGRVPSFVPTKKRREARDGDPGGNRALHAKRQRGMPDAPGLALWVWSALVPLLVAGLLMLLVIPE